MGLVHKLFYKKILRDAQRAGRIIYDAHKRTSN